jgi:hypothetical protein
MEIVERVLVLLHLVGFAALFGGLVVQARIPHPEVNVSMVWGAWLELLTGAGLVALILTSAEPVSYPQLVVKLLLTLVLVLLVSKNRKFSSIPRGLWALIGGLTLLNAVVAVLWQ